MRHPITSCLLLKLIMFISAVWLLRLRRCILNLHRWIGVEFVNLSCRVAVIVQHALQRVMHLSRPRR